MNLAKLGNVSSVASSYSRKERYHPPPPPSRSRQQDVSNKVGQRVFGSVILQSARALNTYTAKEHKRGKNHARLGALTPKTTCIIWIYTMDYHIVYSFIVQFSISIVIPKQMKLVKMENCKLFPFPYQFDDDDDDLNVLDVLFHLYIWGIFGDDGRGLHFLLLQGIFAAVCADVFLLQGNYLRSMDRWTEIVYSLQCQIVLDKYK